MPLPVPPIDPLPFAPGPSTHSIPALIDLIRNIQSQIDELQRRSTYTAGHMTVDTTGIQRPWLAMPTNPVLPAAIHTTSSGSFLAVSSTAQQLIMQPYCQVQALLLSTSGGIGDARYVIDGTAVGTTIAITSGMYSYTGVSVFDLPGPLGGTTTIELQIRRTNAIGEVGGVLWATQRGTP